MFYHFKYICCLLYTNVITLFVNIKTISPKCRPPKSYLPHDCRNTTLQGEEHGDHNIEDRFLNDPMDEDDVIDINCYHWKITQGCKGYSQVIEKTTFKEKT